MYDQTGGEQGWDDGSKPGAAPVSTSRGSSVMSELS